MKIKPLTALKPCIFEGAILHRGFLYGFYDDKKSPYFTNGQKVTNGGKACFWVYFQNAKTLDWKARPIFNGALYDAIEKSVIQRDKRGITLKYSNELEIRNELTNAYDGKKSKPYDGSYKDSQWQCFKNCRREAIQGV